MAGVLIRMKFAILRHSTAGPRAAWMLTGALVGLALAGLTIYLSIVDEHGDLVAASFALWALGWMLAPVWGGGQVLRAEHFALLPLGRVRLAVALLGTAFVGLPAVVSLVAFLATVGFAVGRGPVAVIVAVPAALGQLVLVVVLSRLAGQLFGSLSRSRTGAVVTGVVTAVMMALSQSGWIVFIAIDAVLATGFSAPVPAVLRALPSSWGLVAVEAAGRSDWLVLVAALAGLVLVIGAALLIWARLLGSTTAARAVVHGTAGGRPGSVGRTVLVKELRAWRRDPVRIQSLALAPAFAILSGLVPVAFGATASLAFVGVLTAVVGAAAGANAYGQDGTALWLTLQVPGTERADVRGRQLAWLTWFGSMSVVLTVIGGLLSGRPDLWPYAAAATVAALLGGAGLVPLIAVDQLVPGPDPHRSRTSPVEHGDVTGQAFLMLILVSLVALPAVGAVYYIGWAGVAAAGVLGGFLYWYLGLLAGRQLAARGPELLSLMRTGRAGQEVGVVSAFKTMTSQRRALLWTCFFVGCLALFPQAVAPMGLKLAGATERVWFLALYLPPAWQWPVIAAMAVIGILALGAAGRLYVAARRHPAP